MFEILKTIVKNEGFSGNTVAGVVGEVVGWEGGDSGQLKELLLFLRDFLYCSLESSSCAYAPSSSSSFSSGKHTPSSLSVQLANRLLSLGAPLIFLPLLNNEDEGVRVVVVEIITKILDHSKSHHHHHQPQPPKPTLEKTHKFNEKAARSSDKSSRFSEKNSIFSEKNLHFWEGRRGGKKGREIERGVYEAMGARLGGFPFEEKMQHCLLRILVEGFSSFSSPSSYTCSCSSSSPSSSPLSPSSPVPPLSLKLFEIPDNVHIKVVAILPLLFKLLKVARCELRVLTLQQICLILTKDSKNRKIFAKWRGWREGVIEAVVGGGGEGEESLVGELGLKILRVMVLYFLEEEKGGWKGVERVVGVLEGVEGGRGVEGKLLEEVLRFEFFKYFYFF